MWIVAEPVVPFFICPSPGRSRDSFVCDGGGAQREDGEVRHVNDADVDRLERFPSTTATEQRRLVQAIRSTLRRPPV
jgi:hypothetical protein